MDHGRIGAEIARDLGLPKEITAIMEKHICGGLTETEAKELDLPIKDCTLRKLEEKIVIYEDRLVDIITDNIVRNQRGERGRRAFRRDTEDHPQIREERTDAQTIPRVSCRNAGTYKVT